MRKFNIKLCIMAITAAVLLTASIIVFAAFSYKKNIVSPDVTVGDVIINSKSFISYAKKTNETNDNSSNYYRLCKLRTDTVANIEGISINYSYQKVNISGFSTGVTYYTYDTSTNTYVIAPNYTSGTEYYIRKESVKINQAYNYDTVHEAMTSTDASPFLTTEIDGYNVTLKKGTTVVETITFEITDGRVTNVTLGDPTRRYVIGSNGTNVYIFTKNVGTSVVATTNDTITCYASEREVNDSRIDYTVPYLNQIGLKFEFTTKIPVYVRIHIQDAWISTQFLSSKSERTRYIPKAQISGASPFSVSKSEWYYDKDTNIAYLKTMFEPTKDSNGDYVSQEYTFDVNEGYFYYDTSTQARQKHTTVQVSFTVDIVQANRAEALWNVDFDQMFGN